MSMFLFLYHYRGARRWGSCSLVLWRLMSACCTEIRQTSCVASNRVRQRSRKSKMMSRCQACCGSRHWVSTAELWGMESAVAIRTNQVTGSSLVSSNVPPMFWWLTHLIFFLHHSWLLKSMLQFWVNMGSLNWGDFLPTSGAKLWGGDLWRQEAAHARRYFVHFKDPPEVGTSSLIFSNGLRISICSPTNSSRHGWGTP